MFLPKRRASPFQQCNVTDSLKMVRLSSSVCGRKAEAFFFFCWSLETSLQSILGRRVKNTGCGHREIGFFLCLALKYCAVVTRMGGVLRISHSQTQWPASAMVSVKVLAARGEHVSRRSWSGWHKLAFQIRRVQ